MLMMIVTTTAITISPMMTFFMPAPPFVLRSHRRQALGRRRLDGDSRERESASIARLHQTRDAPPSPPDANYIPARPALLGDKESV